MRRVPNLRLDKFRIELKGYSSPGGENRGAFIVAHRGVKLRVISSGTDEVHGWEHVSVSTQHRTPTWQEMQHIKELFWRDDECVIQYHPAAADWINDHPYCLHMWRPLQQGLPLPPKQLVSIGIPAGLTPADLSAADVVNLCAMETAKERADVE